MNAQPLTGIKKVYFWTGAILPLVSSFGYLLAPSGTVQHFNGEVNNTSKFWCSVVASGDLVVSYLMLSGIFTKSTEVRQLVIRAYWLFSLFHFGAFWFWHNVGDRHRNGLMYPAAMIATTAALLAWGK
ncbi:GPI-anchored surface protein, putative [Bodo saltans]|uniref:GPI-anchored surface protein, putative n=1 Tax=Bodo saltans TaxID=75058 RepID=A0A0S4KM07_BODSA|nr:GPI-anchored surface protein, putative [Bodo saltans]|eukprot:CUI14658.1 GPI-anchored surface protein, putative [Bodo saltans]